MSHASRTVARPLAGANLSPIPAPVRAIAADAPAGLILAAVMALAVGAVVYFSGLAVRRVSLFTFDVAGFLLDAAEVPPEVAYLAAERQAIQEEPSLFRAAEIVERQLLSSFSRGIDGRFSVRRDKVVAGRPVYSARWTGEGDARSERTALNDLASWATGMGMTASRIGFEVIATYTLAGRPGLAKTTPRAALNAERAA
jgi:hypothetical protein